MDINWPQLTNWVLTHTGISLRNDNMGSVAIAVKTLCDKAGCSDWQFLANLKSGQISTDEFIDLLTTNESFFLRYHDLMNQVIRQIIIPLVHSGITPKILSAPCANGEEAYSLAMLLEDAGVNIRQTQITGIDISRACIKAAKAGYYAKYAFRRTPVDFVQRHFSTNAATKNAPVGYQVPQRLLAAVQFRQLNLLTESDLLEGGYHIIFFNNLLIYFNQNEGDRVLQNLKRLMAKDAWIFCDSSEAPRLRMHFLPQPLGDRIGFRGQSTPAKPAEQASVKNFENVTLKPVSASTVKTVRPVKTPLSTALVSTDQRTPSDMEPKAALLLEKAHNLYANKKVLEAQQILETMSGNYPHYRAHSQLALSLILADAGENMQALDLAEAALGLHEGGVGSALTNTEQADAHAVIATILVAKGLTHLAAEYFDKVRSLAPNHGCLQLAQPRKE